MTMDPKERAKRALTRAHDALTAAVGRETASVQCARHLGVTWPVIARALDMPERSVIRKYGPLCKPIPDHVVREAAELELTPDEAAAGVHDAHRARIRAVDGEYRAVHAARDVAVTWREIGEITGMRRADALDKFGTRPQPVAPARKRPARLSPEQRAEIAARLKAGEPARQVAAEFEVSESYANLLRPTRQAGG
jgi:transposase